MRRSAGISGTGTVDGAARRTADLKGKGAATTVRFIGRDCISSNRCARSNLQVVARLESGKVLPAIDDNALPDDEARVLAAQEGAKSTDVSAVAQPERWNADVGNPFVRLLLV